jgi:hypothetical protein
MMYFRQVIRASRKSRQNSPVKDLKSLQHVVGARHRSFTRHGPEQRVDLIVATEKASREPWNAFEKTKFGKTIQRISAPVAAATGDVQGVVIDFHVRVQMAGNLAALLQVRVIFAVVRSIS